MRRFSLLITFVILSAAATTSSAVVVEYQLLKGLGYEQTENDTAPLSPTSFVFFSDLITSFGAFDEVTLQGLPAQALIDLPYDGPFGFSENDWFIELSFNTRALLDANVPDDVTYTIEGVQPSGEILTETLEFETTFPSEVPFFTDDVFESLQGMDPSQDFTFTFPEPPSDVEAFLFIDAVTGFGDTEVFDAGVDGATSVLLNAGTLQPDTEHVALLAYFDTEPDTLDGGPDNFPEGDGRTGHVVFTQIPFRTAVVPEPAAMSVALIATLVAGGVSVSRRASR